MNYPKLEARIAASRFSKKQIAQSLGISEKAFHNKLAGRAPFTWPEVSRLCMDVFPGADPMELLRDECTVCPVLAHGWSKVTVFRNEEEIAVITNEQITTADDSIIVKLTPNQN